MDALVRESEVGKGEGRERRDSMSGNIAIEVDDLPAAGRFCAVVRGYACVWFWEVQI